MATTPKPHLAMCTKKEVEEETPPCALLIEREVHTGASTKSSNGAGTKAPQQWYPDATSDSCLLVNQFTESRKDHVVGRGGVGSPIILLLETALALTLAIQKVSACFAVQKTVSRLIHSILSHANAIEY